MFAASEVPEILVVGGNDVVATIIAKAIAKDIDAILHVAHTAEELRALLGRFRHRIDLAIADIDLPGLERGEVVAVLAHWGVPKLVYCDTATTLLRSGMAGLGVIDVINKDGPASLRYLVTSVQRLLRNHHHTALVVDPQPSYRRLMTKLLSRYRFEALEAADATQALALVAEDRRISLAIIECRQTDSSGADLIMRLRDLRSKDELAIVGCGAVDEIDTLPKMLKAGANDIFKKPFTDEEFYCRVSNATEMIEHVRTIKLSAITDYLSGLYNRRHLYHEGARQRDALLGAGRTPVVAMADIDFFKRVNDTYGHDAGDIVIKKVAHTIREHVGDTGLVARIGGEEFCVLVPDPQPAVAYFDELRQKIEALDIDFQGQRIPVTVSLGVTAAPATSLEAQVSDADKALYAAKQGGRNQVVLWGA